MSGLLDEQPKVIPASSTCAACGEAFGCGATNRCGPDSQACWCFGIELSEAARTELANRYKSCLCQRCLTTWVDCGTEGRP